LELLRRPQTSITFRHSEVCQLREWTFEVRVLDLGRRVALLPRRP